MLFRLTPRERRTLTGILFLFGLVAVFLWIARR